MALYRYSANTVCTQRYWFSGFQGFHGFILVHVQCHSVHMYAESDKGTGFQVFMALLVQCLYSTSMHRHSLSKVLVFMFSRLYRYMTTCTNMYSATTVTVYTQSLTKVLIFKFSWPYRHSANTVCTQRHWFSGFQGFHGLIIYTHVAIGTVALSTYMHRVFQG